VPAALLTLALVAVAGVLVRRAVDRVERAGEIVAGLDVDGWAERSTQLGRTTEQLRDAVDQRQPR
jgi:hypothetical protein